MPLDAACLSALVRELTPALTGARIDKVQQPERDVLLLSLYTTLGPRRLLICSGVGSARLHFTEERLDNPDAPPMFCMLLRKHLIGAHITSVVQPDFERMVILSVSGRDELGVETEKKLVCELMGRASNVLLVDADGRIVDCLRRADFGEDAYRRLLPGMLYRLPGAQRRPCVYTLTDAERAAAYAAADPAAEPEKRLTEAFSGLAPLISREIVFRAGESDNVLLSLNALCETVSRGEFTPTMIVRRDAAPDFSFLAVRQYGDAAECTVYPDFSALLDACYAQRDRLERARRASADTVRAVRTLRDRQARKLAQQRSELAATADREALRRRGDLLKANFWRVRKGDRMLRCEDYFTPGAPEAEVPLDPLKTPQQNAAAFYKEYKKAAAAEAHLTALIADGDRYLDYLESVLDELSRAEGEKDVAEIRRELTAEGILKQPREARARPARSRGPMRFVSSAGLEILVGRGNVQNDELTLRTARKTDLWLHTQRVHGSHVILRTEGKEPDEASVAEAASLAAYYSQARDGGKVPVDYTPVRNVKKPAGALPGMVVYTEYRTLLAQPDAELAARLRREP